MKTKFRKIYDLNDQEALLARQLITLIYSKVNHLNDNRLRETKPKIKNLNWIEEISDFTGLVNKRQFRFEFGHIEIVCNLTGYAVDFICNRANVDHNGKQIRRVRIIENGFATSITKYVFLPNTHKAIFNYIIEFDGLVQNVKEGKIEASSLKTNKITCNTSDLDKHQF